MDFKKFDSARNVAILRTLTMRLLGYQGKDLRDTNALKRCKKLFIKKTLNINDCETVCNRKIVRQVSFASFQFETFLYRNIVCYSSLRKIMEKFALSESKLNFFSMNWLKT